MQTSKAALVILAGGLGSRFGGAKQIAPFGKQGHFLFEYACYDAMKAGFEKVFVIVRSGMEQLVKEQLNKWMADDRFEILVQVQERSKPWGTAHALHFLTGKWAAPFLVLNADDYYGSQICERAIALLQNGNSAAALAFELGPTLSPHGPVARGLCQQENGYLTAIEEVLKIQSINDQIRDEFGRVLAPAQLISMNAWLLPASFLTRLAGLVQAFLDTHATDETTEIYLPKVLDQLIQAGELQIKLAAMPAEWFGITYAADLALAQEKIAELEKVHYPSTFERWI